MGDGLVLVFGAYIILPAKACTAKNGGALLNHALKVWEQKRKEKYYENSDLPLLQELGLHSLHPRHLEKKKESEIWIEI